MDAIECLKTRMSVRRFKEDEIEKDDLRIILECALSAPSGSNLQPWEFFVVHDEERLKKLSGLVTYGRFIKNASFCIVVTGDESKSTHVVEDCSAATENILLAAHALGYGGCWVAGWRKEYEGDVLEIIGTKEKKNLRLVSLVPIGVPEIEIGKKKKRSLEDAVHFL